MGLAIGVTGASGGVGASTLAVVLAVRGSAAMEECRSVVAVDLDPRGGLDATFGLEHQDGLRWPDLEILDRCHLDSSGPMAWDLPVEAGVRVLAGTGADEIDRAFEIETLDRLADCHDLVVVDCGGRPDVRLLARLDVLVIVARLCARGTADARALRRARPLSRTHAVLVTRGPVDPSGALALSRGLGVPLVGHLREDRAVARHAARGEAPGLRPSVLDEVADAALTRLQTVWLAGLMERTQTRRRSA